MKILLCCSLVFVAGATTPIAPPLPAGSTPFQKQLLTDHAEKALALSAAATADMLRLLGNGGAANPEDELDLLRQHLAIAEVVHNFDAWSPDGGGGGMYDVNLTIATENGYFFNQWELDFLSL